MMVRNVDQVGRFELHRLPDGSEVFYDPDPAHAYYGEIKPSKSAKGGYSAVRESRFVGVSTPGKTLDLNNDPLLWWAAGLDQQGIARLVTQTFQGGGDPDLSWLTNPDAIKAKLSEEKLTWWHVRQATADRGTNVHEQILLALAQEERPPSLARLSDAERAYGQAAIRWWRDNDPIPLFAEQVTFSAEHRVAGRFDLLVEIDGERVLVDAKTREKGVARKTDHAQLAGYEMCNRACGIGPSDRQIALILKPDGDYEAVDSVGTEGDFLAALAAYRQAQDLDKRLRAAEKEAVSA